MTAVPITDGRGYRIRLIRPATSGPTQTILGKAFGFTELPIVHAPTSHDLVEGSYTLRLGDSGEFSLTFPNAASVEGPWRTLFDADKARHFIEVYRDDMLEFVGSVQRVEVDRGQVVVSGADASSLLRRAEENDRTWTAAPRDIIDAYTRVPLPLVAEPFAGSTLDAAWTASSSGGTITVGGGRVKFRDTTSGVTMSIIRNISGVTDTWRASCLVARYAGTGGTRQFRLIVLDSGTRRYELQAFFGSTTTVSFLGVESGGSPFTYSVQIQLPILTAPATLAIEGQGHFVRAFIDGRLVGYLPILFVPTRLKLEVFTSLPSNNLTEVEIEETALTSQTAFLQRGADKGDYVLPGDLPIGGLHGRYANNGDLTTANFYEFGIHAPNRGFYADRLDPVVDTAGGLALPAPGGPPGHFSVRWFGAVYLRLDLGNYPFELTNLDGGARLWVGKTAWNQALIDSWVNASGTKTATLTASSLGSKSGWYPIVLEYFSKPGVPEIHLQYTPPAAYTDPGGTAIGAGVKRVVPLTSLSPIGCFDNRVQAQSHFDLVYRTAQDFGYEITCEPLQLESGEFPGRLAPRVRVGRDTDVILEPEETDDVYPILSPAVTFDGSEQVFVLRGSGSGLPDSEGGQVTAQVTDLANVGAALFALEGRVDAGEIAFPDLLAARLDAELGLRSSPWEEVRGIPRAQEGLADTWPLTNTLSAMRWRPGDGVRVRVPDIGVEDGEPRRLIQVTRAFASAGRTGTQVGFRQRPRTAARSVRTLLRAALAPSRNLQGWVATLESPGTNPAAASTAAAGFTSFEVIGLQSGDRIVKATLRILFNSAAQALGVEINTADRTAALNGPWSVVPVEVNLLPYAAPVSATDQRMVIRLQNQGASATIIQFQVFIEVLR